MQDGRIFIELVNRPFLDAGAAPGQFRAALARAIELGWLWRHESGTYLKFTLAGAARERPAHLQLRCFLGFSDAAGAVTWAPTSGDANAIAGSPFTCSCPTSRRGQAKSSARPAGADKGSPLTNTRVASASFATGRDPGPPTN